ncbi:Myb-like DNA-binding domain containing protein [Plasmodiophora brassicae]
MFERLFQSRTRPSLVTDPMALKMDREERRTSRWTDDEHAAFLKAFAATPKNFTAIAAALKGKSRAECVFHYYDCKNQVSYPVLKSKTPPRRRHR